ncbi:hypothetical protein DPMN_088576 [Dreissena polymorpha]|uniref:Uncharacterized protein n=1 Tax=Dreissena polymorpha TaxID=45954 RepID=A0A9D4KUB9_DREPO|nr:hypothetical protein DPMN_088576 [Dreissena polymorpha]
MSEPFYIKDLSGGRYVQPASGYYGSLILNSDVKPTMEWRFVQIEGQWGYIEHKSSGQIIHPSFQSTKATANSLTLSRLRRNVALFAFDQVNNHIIHKNGG